MYKAVLDYESFGRNGTIHILKYFNCATIRSDGCCFIYEGLKSKNGVINMVSIQSKGKKHYVVYRLKDELGNWLSPKWEPFDTYEEAEIRLAEVDLQIKKSALVPKSHKTVAEFLDIFVNHYGAEKWEEVAYQMNVSIIEDYIKPTIGDITIGEVKPLFIMKYYKRLCEIKSIKSRFDVMKTVQLTEKTIKKIHMLLKCAFDQAVLWEMLPNNPFDKVDVPKSQAQQPFYQDSGCHDSTLKICCDTKLLALICLAVITATRLSEMICSTWDIDMSELVESIKKSPEWQDELNNLGMFAE